MNGPSLSPTASLSPFQNTRDPEWNEDFPFRVPVAPRQASLLGCDSYLNVQVYDRNSGRPGVDAYLGGAQVSLAQGRPLGWPPAAPRRCTGGLCDGQPIFGGGDLTLFPVVCGMCGID